MIGVVLGLVASLLLLPGGQRMTCNEPAPRTPEGYKALWDTIPKLEWGAADVSLSVRMGDRRVWLYGDTMSEAEDGIGFVHSTAIVQEGGCLNVSNNGQQLLPNDDPRHIYWINKGWRVEDSTNLLRVKATSIRLLASGGPWGFEYNGFSKIATLRLQEDNDVAFIRWERKIVEPEPDPGPLIDLDEPGPSGHFAYSIRRHMLLPDGRRLMTVCQGWDDGVWHGWDDYRPIFYAEGEEPWL